MKETVIFIIAALYIFVAAMVLGALITQDINENNGKPIDMFLDIVFAIFWPVIFIIGKIFKV